MAKIRDNLLTIAIVWLSFTAILMYKHALYYAPPAVEYINKTLLLVLVAYALYRYPSPLTGAVIGVFIGYAVTMHRLGPIGQLSVLQVLTFGVGYIAISREYTPRDILRQMINAGWFIWLWCWFGFVMQLLGGYPLNAGTSIVFQPHVASVLFGMLLPLGLEIDRRAARYAYLTLGAGVMLSVMWRSRISVVIFAVLIAAYCWRYIHDRALWQRLLTITAAAVVAVAGIVYLVSWKPSSVVMRAELWPRTLAEWSRDRRTMLFGVGLGRMRVYSDVETQFQISKKIADYGYQTIMLPNDEPHPIHAPGAHNSYLTTLYETGAVGFTLYCLALLVLWHSRSYRSYGVNLALLALAASNLTGDSTHCWHIAAMTVCCIATTNWTEYKLKEALQWRRKRLRMLVGSGG